MGRTTITNVRAIKTTCMYIYIYYRLMFVSLILRISGNITSLIYEQSTLKLLDAQHSAHYQSTG